MKDKHADEATDLIDACIFSSDIFQDKEDREELRRLMARWERGLKEFDKLDEQ